MSNQLIIGITRSIHDIPTGTITLGTIYDDKLARALGVELVAVDETEPLPDGTFIIAGLSPAGEVTLHATPTEIRDAFGLQGWPNESELMATLTRFVASQ